MVATGSLSSKNPASISELLDCGYHPESLLSDFDYWDYVVPEPNLNEDLPLNKPRFHVGEKQVEKKKTKILGFRPKNILEAGRSRSRHQKIQCLGKKYLEITRQACALSSAPSPPNLTRSAFYSPLEELAKKTAASSREDAAASTTPREACMDETKKEAI
ncbi:DNA damage-inducible transcript 4-like protein isoform X3 [Macaca nemestrina]|uniref:DNA damage-inducible transcript 4-like protein isoform X3 n=1 Tax=Macaca nemestrina TaxID=9545 RepID=UPI0039B865F0